MRSFIHPMYPVNIYISVQENHEELLKQLGKEWSLLPPLDEGTRAETSAPEEAPSYILMRFDEIDNAIIAHESFHCSELIMKYIGAKLDVDNNEFQAYLIEYIVHCVEETIKNPTEPKKK